MRDAFLTIRTAPTGARVRQVSMFDACNGRWLASFTTGARTVLMRGPLRTFRESDHVVRHAFWVRTSPRPFDEQDVDPRWLARALDANAREEPDVLALAMQYLAGRAPILSDGDPPLQIAGDASYGPVVGDTREEGADFNDYLGIAWSYPGEATDAPEPRQFRCLDCSGYVRMVFGFRRNLTGPDAGHIELCRAPRKDRSALPRRAHEMASHAPGVLVVPPSERDIASSARLAPGDLVFFDADAGDGPQIDHVGIYVGCDTKGHHRFVSSRKRADGPTMGDVGGRSTLDGDGLYARAFVAARRL